MKSVRITVKIEMKDDANIEEVIQECDYNFSHPDILGTEIVDIQD